MCQGQHQLLHRKEEDEPPLEAAAYGSGPDGAYAENTEVAAIMEVEEFDWWKEEMYPEDEFGYWNEEKMYPEDLGAVAVGAFAMYKKLEAEKDPEDAHRHEIEEEDAAAAAGDAEPEVDNKKQDEHGKHSELLCELSFTVNNPLGSLSVNFRGLLGSLSVNFRGLQEY